MGKGHESFRPILDTTAARSQPVSTNHEAKNHGASDPRQNCPHEMELEDVELSEDCMFPDNQGGKER